MSMHQGPDHDLVVKSASEVVDMYCRERRRVWELRKQVRRLQRCLELERNVAGQYRAVRDLYAERLVAAQGRLVARIDYRNYTLSIIAGFATGLLVGLFL